ncbi:MAG: biotin--[acetyl-CoA-carboxylase] ligase [Alphaproteobacteria bacterium]|nr:biotin--[acetyl-CoA-carboxylase] ligase [Alphaproteobacteria bacterium]
MIPPFFTLRCLDSVESTNLIAREAAESGQPEGLVIQAKSQINGKGRLGRTWQSPEGNLYVSVLLRPDCSIQNAGQYSFAAAMAVYDAIAEVHRDTALSLKWPNDVLINDEKVSGILIDVGSADQNRVDWLVVGVGINVGWAPQEDLPYPATSLRAHGADVRLEVVLDAFLCALHHWYLTLKYDGFDPVRRAWLSDVHRGPLSIRFPTCEINGNFAGLDSDGGLILRLADGSEKVIHAGDVFLM